MKADKKGITILHQKSVVDNYFTLDLQKRFTEVIKLELQNGLDKETKNFERSDKEKEKEDIRTFCEKSHGDSS